MKIDLYDKQSYNKDMKVTALLPEKLIKEVQTLSNGKNVTESIFIALNEWTSNQKIRKLNQKIRQQPLKFIEGFTAEKIRKLNRKV